MYGVLDISTSGMIAQRTRLDAIAANLANVSTLEDAQGRYSPYRRRDVQFAPGDPTARTAAGRAMGVYVAQIRLDQSPFDRRYDPTNRWADKDGYIMAPNINPVIEQINAIDASRAYEANVAAAEATKAMTAQALRLIA